MPKTVARSAKRSKARPTLIQPSGFSSSAIKMARPADESICFASFWFSEVLLAVRPKINGPSQLGALGLPVLGPDKPSPDVSAAVGLNRIQLLSSLRNLGSSN